jgi:hypothetical protein
MGVASQPSAKTPKLIKAIRIGYIFWRSVAVKDNGLIVDQHPTPLVIAKLLWPAEKQ